MSRYDAKQVAKELQATAQGDSYYGNALYVARDYQCLTDDDRVCLTRWLVGSNTSQDRFQLQDIAIRLHESV